MALPSTPATPTQRTVFLRLGLRTDVNPRDLLRKTVTQPLGCGPPSLRGYTKTPAFRLDLPAAIRLGTKVEHQPTISL